MCAGINQVRIVAYHFHDVDFRRPAEAARQQPDRRPQARTRRQLRTDLDEPIFKIERFFGGDDSRVVWQTIRVGTRCRGYREDAIRIGERIHPD